MRDVCRAIQCGQQNVVTETLPTAACNSSMYSGRWTIFTRMMTVFALLAVEEPHDLCSDEIVHRIGRVKVVQPQVFINRYAARRYESAHCRRPTTHSQTRQPYRASYMSSPYSMYASHASVVFLYSAVSTNCDGSLMTLVKSQLVSRKKLVVSGWRRPR